MKRFGKILALVLTVLMIAASFSLWVSADNDPVKLTVDPTSISGTAGNGSSEGLAQMFDGDKNSKYLTATVPAEVIFALEESAVVDYYELTSADHAEWDPKAWTLYGSADGQTWTQIDSQSNQDFLLTPGTNGYEIDNATAYLWYKIVITESHGEAYGFYIAVSEMELFSGAPAEEEIEGIVVDLTSVTGTAGNGSSEGLVQAFDGNLSSKYLTATVPAEIIFSLKKTAVVNRYSLTSTDHGEWDPKAWTLYGSDDASTWFELDAQEDQNFVGRGVTNTYYFENEDEYLWYKLEITESHGEAFGFSIAVAELVLAYGAPEAEVIAIDPATVTGTPGNGESEGLAQMFDGSAGSKYLTSSVPAEIVFALNKSAVINYYELTSTDHGEWDPKAWTLYGSEDGTEWIAIDERSAQDFEGRGTTNSYFFDNEDEYLWYKLVIAESHGEAFGFSIAVAEMTVDCVKVNTETIDGSAGNGDDNIYNLFDGRYNTKYLVFRSSDDDVVEVQFQLTKPVVVNTYRIASANDWPVRDPKNWRVFGSDDGQSWVQLDEREDAVFQGRNISATFQFNNEDAYDWYRFEFTANNGNDPWGNNIIQLSEIELFNTEEVFADDFVVIDKDTLTGSQPYNDSHTLDKLFDNDSSTKYLTSGTTMFVAFALKEAKAINAYTLTCANDWASRSPSDWIFYGSADGENWTVLDTRTGETPTGLQEDDRYVFDNDTPYLWYKLEVTRNGGNGITGFAELTLEVTEDPWTKTTQRQIVSDSVTAPDGTSNNGVANLLDGNRSTRYLVKNDGAAFDVLFRLDVPAVINRYAISGSKDHLERSPKTFSLYGSYDGTVWKLLDHRDLEGRSSSDPNYFCGDTFSFENHFAYEYYKLVIEAVTAGDYCGMSAFAVFTEEREGEELEHEFGEWSEWTESTYTEQGQRSRICTVCGVEETEYAPFLSGFVKEEKELKYYENGALVKGWKEFDGRQVYFRKTTGEMIRHEEALIGGSAFVFEPFEYEGYTLWAGTPKGEPVKNGVVKDPDGIRFYENGVAVKGWVEIDGNQVYFSKKNGVMIHSEEAIIGGETYVFEEFYFEGIKLYAGSVKLNVKNGLYKEPDGIRYYENDVMVKGWVEIDGNTLYFSKKTGLMNKYADIVIGGVAYKFEWYAKVDGMNLWRLAEA